MVETDEKTGCTAFPHRLYPATMKTAQALQRMWSHAVKKLGILKGHVSCFLLHLAPRLFFPSSPHISLPSPTHTARWLLWQVFWFCSFSVSEVVFGDLSVTSNCVNLWWLSIRAATAACLLHTGDFSTLTSFLPKILLSSLFWVFRKHLSF